jgi:hypothetical protein
MSSPLLAKDGAQYDASIDRVDGDLPFRASFSCWLGHVAEPRQTQLFESMEDARAWIAHQLAIRGFSE